VNPDTAFGYNEDMPTPVDRNPAVDHFVQETEQWPFFIFSQKNTSHFQMEKAGCMMSVCNWRLDFLVEEHFLAVNRFEDFRAALYRGLREVFARAELAKDTCFLEFLLVLAEGLVDDLVVFYFDDQHKNF
jgi:hypothetical protein